MAFLPNQFRILGPPYGEAALAQDDDDARRIAHISAAICRPNAPSTDTRADHERRAAKTRRVRKLASFRSVSKRSFGPVVYAASTAPLAAIFPMQRLRDRHAPNSKWLHSANASPRTSRVLPQIGFVPQNNGPLCRRPLGNRGVPSFAPADTPTPIGFVLPFRQTGTRQTRPRVPPERTSRVLPKLGSFRKQLPSPSTTAPQPRSSLFPAGRYADSNWLRSAIAASGSRGDFPRQRHAPGKPSPRTLGSFFQALPVQVDAQSVIGCPTYTGTFTFLLHKGA
jgi:hypothetical protein